MRPPTRPRPHAVAVPLSWLYRGVMAARNAIHDRGIGVTRAPIPVISIGNLTVGGTGKTPLVARSVSLLRELGARPAVVSRGYGGRAGRGPMRVTTEAAPGNGPERTGDEPWMLASRFPDLPVIVGSDRRAGVRAAVDVGADVAVLDDGFQHRRLARDLDVVVLPARRPFGNGHLLPAGPLREPPSSLGRADLLVRVGNPCDPVEEIPGGPLPVPETVHATRVAAGFADHRGRAAPPPERAVLFCGIGDPGSFRALAEAAGIRPVEFVAYPDHHPFRHDELRDLSERARRHRAPLVTTEKDLSRLHGRREELAEGEGLLCLRLDLEMPEEETFRGALRRTLERGARG